MGLSSMLRRDAGVVWGEIFRHPFVAEVFRGSLPLSKFRFYVVQDYNYLVAMMRCYSLVAARADPEVSAEALRIAYADATVEMDAYRALLGELGLRVEDVVGVEPAPTNLSYTSYLLATCSLGTPLECLVATLPCFWTYLEIAERWEGELSRNPVPIYRRWGETYLSREYRDLVTKLRNLVDRLWDGRDYWRYLKHFTRASRYEYMFWDMAYRMEGWPP